MNFPLAPFPSDFLFSRSQDGELLPFGGENSRTTRWLRRATSQADLLRQNRRISFCGKTVLRDLELRLSEGATSAHFSGVLACGSIWVCPVCAAKISARRAGEIALACAVLRSRGFEISLATFTVRHSENEPLGDVSKRLFAVWKNLTTSQTRRNVWTSSQVQGTVRALEVTSGFSGWHPHFHVVFFSKSLESLFDLGLAWRSTHAKLFAGDDLSENAFDLRPAASVAAYLAKLGFEAAAGQAKNTSFFSLLDRTGNSKIDSALRVKFQHFANELSPIRNGRVTSPRQIAWSKNLKKTCGIGEKTDEEISEEANCSGELLATLSREDFRKFLSLEPATQAGLLAMVPTSGAQGFFSTLQLLSQIPPTVFASTDTAKNAQNSSDNL